MSNVLFSTGIFNELGIGQWFKKKKEKQPNIVFFYTEEGLKTQEWLLANQVKIKEALSKLGINTIEDE